MKRPRPPIAVVGVSALFPGSRDTAGFWRDILAGRDLITEVPPSHWLIDDYYDPDPKAPDKTYAKRGAFLDPIEFDPLEHGVPPNLIPATDTSQLLALIVAKQVLEDATRGQFEKLDRDRVSVILGLTSGQELLVEAASRLQRPIWVKALREQGLGETEVQATCDRIASSYVPWQEGTFPGLLGNVVAGRIANRLNLGGTNCVTDAACASALSALHMGLGELYLGDSDLVLVGGVETFNDIFMFMCFSKTPALSFQGECRPFDAQADGTLLGEGLGFVALRRLEDAERDGDHVYAVIRGLGTSSDGRAKSVYAPVSEGQAKALRRAYDAADYGPETVELVEAHGTGTKAGDVAELEGLRSVFEASGRRDRQWCALGSVKSQIGHTKAAAGAAGLIKAVLALHHKVLPPTIKVDRPNPALEVEKSPFYINTKARPWIKGRAHPRRASVSSFGFGGSNYHVTLEEYRGGAPQAPRATSCCCELVTLAAEDPARLVAECRSAAASDEPLSALARSTQEAFDPRRPARLAVVASTRKDLADKLDRVAQALAADPEKAVSAPGIHYQLGGEKGALAFLFPGQGSQYLHMGAGLLMSFDAAREVFDRAADLELGETPLHDVVFPRPAFDEEDRRELERRLTATEWAQPAIGATSLSMLALLRQLGLQPALVGGHSFGEITALHAAGVLDEAGVLRVARRRGELMAQATATPGAMIAVAHPVEELLPLIAEHGADLVLANHNAPRQAVVSGTVEAVEAFAALLAERGITARRLPVSTAFHSPLVAPATGPLRDFLETVPFEAAGLPVFSNTEAGPYPDEPEAKRRLLAEQVARPVRFADQIEAMYRASGRVFVEVGPGSVLTSLVSQCLEGRPHLAVSLDRKGRSGLTAFWEGLGRLAVAGMPLDFARLWEPMGRPVAPSTRRPKNGMTITLSGTNYGKPYPPEGGARALPPPNPETAVAARRASAPVAEQAPPSPPLPASNPPAAPGPWMGAYLEMQRQTAEAHAAYQRAMAESHAAFLRASEASFAALSAMAGGHPVPDLASRQIELPPVPTTPSLPPPGPATWPGPPPTATIDPELPEKDVVQAGAPPATVPAGSSDTRGTLLSVVAEKTGYPAEMLKLEMQLESDLGIDSIKRVEILSALQERIPDLPQVSASEMGALSTLGEIVARLESVRPAGAAPAASAVGPDLETTLLAVVAEKTGYPAEMLRPEMELESDLGIDSIKRVEILSTMQERIPQVAQLASGEMASLRTLGQIVERLRQDGTGLAAARASEPSSPPPTVAPSAGALQSLLLSVVAEKTGYPAEMLRPEMELESDLGIDSIKRVEILSAMSERVTGLPQVSAGEMGALRTLGEVAGRLSQAGIEAEPVPAQEPETPPESRAPGSAVGRFGVEARPAPALGFALPGISRSGDLAITEDGAGVASALLGLLRERGLKGDVVTTVPDGAGAVIFLGGLAELSSPEDGIAIGREAFQAARTVAPRMTERGGVFVTVQDVGGDFGLGGREPLRAWLSGLSGLAKTAALEWPKASVKAIDVERGGRPATAIAEAIAAELLGGGPEIEVGLRADGTRLVLEVAERPVPDGALGVGPGSVVVATGGARGVTATALIELARACQPSLALLGRTELREEPESCRGLSDEKELTRALLAERQAEGRTLSPAEVRGEVHELLARREVRETLSRLRAAGSAVEYLSVDVQDMEAVARALEQVRQQFGPVTGLVHGAGVIADRLIADKTDAQFDRVLRTKVGGLRALLAATADDPLSFIALFSSVAARSGNVGQADYAMANEVLNKVAAAEARRRGSACLVRSLGWGPWDGGMVGPALRTVFDQRGVPLIRPEDGARRFLDELREEAEGPVELVEGDALALSGESRPRHITLEVVVDRTAYPFLEGHRVRDVAVVPVVLVLEWFARAALALRPDLDLVACRDLKVQQGVRLQRFGELAELLTVAGREISNGSRPLLALELRDATGRICYTATAELADRGTPVPPSTWRGPDPERLEASPWPFSDVYERLLFHGPSFHALRTIEGLSPEGGAAELVGTGGLGWPGGPWLTDPAALDGGLQLSILWGLLARGRSSLPTGVGAFVRHQKAPSDGALRCTLAARVVGDYKLVCDLSFGSDEGGLVAELRDVEMHLLPATDDQPSEELAEPTAGRATP